MSRNTLYARILGLSSRGITLTYRALQIVLLIYRYCYQFARVKYDFENRFVMASFSFNTGESTPQRETLLLVDLFF
ncbi:hypothetical protein SAMN05421647_102156 [Marinobacterium stanieri]|uniref:Uncharacterized protein n=1 Tax=Marinobacterium stanieri TaxID=49186 RepID=A0A1N6Q0C9_9GAMM|nr:hypothetical protein SAMN05421647_102156 [Marinobacterium stanieri]